MFQAGNKIAEVQVTGDASSNLRNGLATPGTLAGFQCYKSTALNSSGGTDQVTMTGLATDSSENIVMAGHISSLLQRLTSLRPKWYVQLNHSLTLLEDYTFLVEKFLDQKH